MKEIWRDIKNYEGLYQISNLGRVKSLDIYVKHSKGGYRIRRGRLLSKGKMGYEKRQYFFIVLHKEGRKRNFKIGRLVYQAFIGDLLKGMDIDHIDNNPLNDRVDNLQQITHRKNCSKDRKKGVSKYTGVSWNKSSKKWQTMIQIKGKQVFLGYYINEIAAKKAYDEALKRLDI